MESDAAEMEELSVVRESRTHNREPRIQRNSNHSNRCKRYIVALMTLIATFLAHSLEANLSLVIEIMTMDSQVVVDNETYIDVAQFNWTASEKSSTLNAFYWGYMLSPFGGYFSTKFGGADIFGIAIVLSGVLTILTPLIAHAGLMIFVLTRIITGIFIGFSASASTDIFVHWAPPEDRTRLTSSLCVATYGSYALNSLICNFIIRAFSYEVLFFQSGTLCLIWYFIWTMLISNDPSKDSCISRAEQSYLTDTIAFPSDEVIYPWKKIFSSLSVWAFINARFVDAWSLSFLINHVPVYLKDTFNTTSKEDTVLWSIFQACPILVVILAAVVADNLRMKRLNPSKVHQLFLGFSHCFPTILLIYVIFRKTYFETMFCFLLFLLCCSIANVSYFTFCIDMASRYASLVIGLSNTFVVLGLMLNNAVVHLLISNHTQSEWTVYICLLVMLNIWAAAFFFFYGSGYPQAWTLLRRHNAIRRRSTVHSSLVNYH